MSEGNATVQIFLVDAMTRYKIFGKANQENFDKVDSVIHYLTASLDRHGLVLVTSNPIESVITATETNKKLWKSL